MLDKLPHGIYTMLVTPMDENENIDFGALRAQIDWAGEKGTDGIVVTPSIGEFACLSYDERWKCFAVCAEHVRDNYHHIKLIATTADTCLSKIAMHTTAAKDLGYMAAQVIPPYYWIPDSGEVFAHYEGVAEMGLPVVVYHNPKLSKFNISPAFMGTLARIPGIVGIKEVKTDRQVHLEALFKEVNGAVPIFTTFRAFTTGLMLGSGGGFINVFALEPCVAMWRLWQKSVKDDSLAMWKKAEAIQNMTNEVFPRGGEDNQRHIGSTKLAASIVTGINMGEPRSPYRSPKDSAQFDATLQSTLPKLRELIASVVLK